MRVRPAKENDFEDIMSCVKRVKKEYFEAKGIPQWQGDYPGEKIFLEDFRAGRLFVMYMGECLIGFASIGFEADPCYEKVENGAWKKDCNYAVVHRFAINPDWQGMGMGETLMNLADKLCEMKNIGDIRADTHEQNEAMQKLLEKCGFEKIGVIHLEDGAPRLAYEKVL
jgi:RimJ/RimL family protein N-acetyltransferase